MMIRTVVRLSLVAAALCGCWEDTTEAQRVGADPDPGGDADGMVGGDLDPGGACEAGETRCGEDGERDSCGADGRWVDDPCDETQACVDGTCQAPVVCTPNDSRCASDLVLEVCKADGSGWDQTACGERCLEGSGTASCNDLECQPGESACQDVEGRVVIACADDGSGWAFSERCRPGTECNRAGGEATCVPLCILSEKLKTNVGCDYWAVDLDNAFVPGGERGFLDAAAAPFAVVVSNPHQEFTAEVTVLNVDGQVDVAIVPPLGLHVFNLPRRDVDGTVISPFAYRVRSSIPIVAYQFNPLDNEEVFSNDASLLLPSNVLGDEYYVMTREQSFARLRGYLTVAIPTPPSGEAAEVEVVVRVTARTQPGVPGIPAMEPGDEFRVFMQPFDVLNIETAAPGADLTGSYITATRNVVVFGGSEAANVPNTNHCVDVDEVTGEGVCEYKRDEPCRTNYDCNEARLNTCCADHLEQQLYPVGVWRSHYIATKSYDRGLENDYWRILAKEDDTKVETVPPQAVVPTLNRGEFFEFGSREHFEIISDKPVLVGQFLASEQAPNPNLRDIHEAGDAGTGDPAFILAVPEEQFRKDYVFLAPDKYAFDYVSIVRPTGVDVFFDDLPVAVEWERVGTGEQWEVARFAIGDGVHFVQAAEPVSVIVYGYDQYVSYGYPGGLNLDVDSETGEGQE